MAEYKDIEQIKKHPYFDELHNCAYVNPNYRSGIDKVLQIINETPIADVEKVVRCRDCVAGEKTTLEPFVCSRNKMLVYNNSYCSYGKRRST